MSRKTHKIAADLHRLPKCGKSRTRKNKAPRFGEPRFQQRSAAGVAAAAVAAGGFGAAVTAAIQPVAAAAVDPNDDDGDDHDDPEGLISATEEPTPAVVTIASVHRSYLLNRFLTSSYSTGRNLCGREIKKSRAASGTGFVLLYSSSFRR